MWGLATVRLLVPRHASAPRHPGVGASVMRLSPALTGRGFGVASGATKLVPAILSGLAQCRKQCPLTIRAKVLHVLRRFLRLPLAPPGIDENAGRLVDVDGIFIQRIE